jgi:hypothetical protein
MLCALLGGAGCDLVAKAGETLELANGGTTFGTGGNAQTRPGRAVTVEDGGTVVVKDATVLGGGILVQQVDQQRFTRAGAGIFSAGGGTIRVEQGVVAGGGVALQVALPEATFDEPAPGIEATDSSIEVMGGTVRGGALVSEVGPFPRPPVNMAPRVPGPAIVSMRGTLNLRGGSFMPGAMDPVDPLIPPVAVITVGSQLNILGGSFRGAISTQNSQTRIRAGTFDVLLVIGGCAEIRGGQINELDVLGNRAGIALLGGRVVVAGSGLTLTPITPSDPALGLSRLTGTLENGQPVNVRVTNSPLFGGVVQLVAPRAAGCP